MSDHWCPDLSAPCVGANLEQMACRRQTSELPLTGKGLETGASLLQITGAYLPLLVTWPLSDPFKDGVSRDALQENIKHQGKAITGNMLPF